jgi:small Trp-rich protein
MWFIVLGVLLIVMKLADFGAVAAWSWWVVLAPFGLAALWWAYSDASGLTKRREMDKLDDKKRERRRKALDALGIDRESQKRGEAADRARRAAANRVEGGRAKKREEQEKVVRDSVIDSKSSKSSSTFEDSRQEPSKKK